MAPNFLTGFLLDCFMCEPFLNLIKNTGSSKISVVNDQFLCSSILSVNLVLVVIKKVAYLKRKQSTSKIHRKYEIGPFPDILRHTFPGFYGDFLDFCLVYMPFERVAVGPLYFCIWRLTEAGSKKRSIKESEPIFNRKEGKSLLRQRLLEQWKRSCILMVKDYVV